MRNKTMKYTMIHGVRTSWQIDNSMSHIEYTTLHRWCMLCNIAASIEKLSMHTMFVTQMVMFTTCVEIGSDIPLSLGLFQILGCPILYRFCVQLD